LSDTTVNHLRELAELPDLEGTRYRVQHELGRGGMGTVYLATDMSLKRDVALKVLHMPLVSPEMIARMSREANVIARLEHPGIVPVHDAGTLPDGRVFYVMKLVRGQSLAQAIDGLGSINDRLRIFLKACEAVAFAHANGVIHRDLKPDNIMLGPFGEVLVMDWGTAKVSQKEEMAAENGGDIESSDTAHGLIIGTRAYMSPEQAAGSAIDERSDIYSLGAVLKFLLNPHEPSEQSTLIADAEDNAINVPSRAWSKDVPKPLAAICSKALAHDRAQRFTRVEELATDVSNFLDGQSVSAYRENILEKLERFGTRHRFIILLVLAYLLMRILLLLFSGR
jgi:serine/threonine protein kinase